MKNSILTKMIMVAVIMALTGLGTNVYAADNAPGDTTRPMMGQKKAGSGACPNLTDEEKEQFQAERQRFYESTKDLKRNIYQKYLELQAEMAKKDPDKKKATAIQKQISELQSQMGAKRLEHRFNLKEINPDLGSGMGKFHNKGKRMQGRMHHRN